MIASDYPIWQQVIAWTGFIIVVIILYAARIASIGAYPKWRARRDARRRGW